MPLILIIVALIGLKLADIWRFNEVSWWHIAGVMLFAFIWFEFIEKILGLDKKKAHNEDEKRRKERVAKSFKNK